MKQWKRWGSESKKYNMDVYEERGKREKVKVENIK